MLDGNDKLIKLIRIFAINKKVLIGLIKFKYNINISKNSTYNTIIDIVGKKQLLNLFDLHDIDEGYRKLEIIKLISHLNKNQVNILAKELNLPGETKGECLLGIWRVKESTISEKIKKLYAENKISGVHQYNTMVLGPLGILNSCYEREKEYDDIIDLLYNFTIIDLRKIAESLKIENTNENKDDFVQKILITHENETILLVISKLGSEKLIKIPEISEWSKLIITSCGIFERKDYVYHPKEELRDFLLKEVPHDDLKSVISHESGIEQDTLDIDISLLEYCVNNSPEKVIKKFFSYSDILK
ncbi:MAG: hypothetical protein KAT05_08155, partial [Spirochaetes bacterium]|nr:hypothetical protein [Spirochaetota bacterium]